MCFGFQAQISFCFVSLQLKVSNWKYVPLCLNVEICSDTSCCFADSITGSVLVVGESHKDKLWGRYSVCTSIYIYILFSLIVYCMQMTRSCIFTILAPLTTGNSWVGEGPTPLKEICSRTHAECWGEPKCQYIWLVPLNLIHKLRFLLHQRGNIPCPKSQFEWTRVRAQRPPPLAATHNI